MNLELTFDAEQTSALDDLVAEYNTGRDVPLTSAEYLQAVVTGIVNDRVKRNFEQVATQLVTAAKSAPYEKRLQLIATVQNALSE